MKYAYVIAGVIITGALLVPRITLARTDFFFDAPDTIEEGETIRVPLYARTDESINAVEGVVRFDAANTKIVAIDDTGSAVSFWIIRPAISQSGAVRFAGIIPGGSVSTATSPIPVLTLLVTAQRPVNQLFWLDEATTYLNRPEPQLDSVTVKSTTIGIVVSRSSDSNAINLAHTLPEISMSDAKTPTMFNGSRFLVFYVRGGYSGTRATRVRESFLGLPGQWHDAISPYRLEDQQRTSMIELEVRDGAGGRFMQRIIPIRLWLLWFVMACVGIGSMIAVYQWRGRTH